MRLVIYRRKFGIKVGLFKRFSKDIVKKIRANFDLQKTYAEYVFGFYTELDKEQFHLVKVFKAIFENIAFFDVLLFNKLRQDWLNFIRIRYFCNGKTSLNEYEKFTNSVLKKIFIFNIESKLYRNLNIKRRAVSFLDSFGNYNK